MILRNQKLACLALVIVFFGFTKMAKAQEDWKVFKPETTSDMFPESADSTIQTSTYNYMEEFQKFENLLEMMSKDLQKGSQTSGYRLQIYFSSGSGSKSKALEVQSEFMTKFKDIPCHIIYQAPNFKVRVGDFRTRLEAEEAKSKIITEFPSAFIAKDFIEVGSKD